MVLSLTTNFHLVLVDVGGLVNEIFVASQVYTWVHIKRRAENVTNNFTSIIAITETDSVILVVVNAM